MAVTYFENLSSGMKARIDPVSRLLSRREPIYRAHFPPKNINLFQSDYTMWPFGRRKLSGELKIRKIFPIQGVKE